MTHPRLDSVPLPDALRETVNNWMEAAASKPGLESVLDEGAVAPMVLARAVACSGYIADTLLRYPEAFAGLVSDGRLGRPVAADEFDTLCEDACGAENLSEKDFLRELRRFRHRELVRIAWRDLAGDAPVEETLAELSALADALIKAALARATAELLPRYGRPLGADGKPSTPAILAMGKLGGRELNFSSDVDLVFLYSSSGETDGRRTVTNEEYFRALSKRIITCLSQNTVDGFVYRVDVRLRPFGDSGPLALSLSALEGYLLQHGRDWERYAYVKARVVNRWDATRTLERDILRPFVYRRYLDFGVFDSLRDMKSMIEAEVKRREYTDNIKLGPGGIREIEFIVQSLQLVRGGTVAELRERELLTALPALVANDCLPTDVTAELREAYRFLRRLENRLQAIADRQTHDLPDDALDRARLVLAMECEDWPALRAQVDQHRRRVATHFRNILFHAEEKPSGAAAGIPAAQRVWTDGVSREEARDLLAGIGFGDPDAALDALEGYRESGDYRRMDEIGRQRLDLLMPAIIDAAGRQPEPRAALAGAIQIVDAIGRRSAYFALLNENPAALERLVSLCGMSGFLARQVATHPLLLDELLDQRIFLEPPDRDDLEQELEQRVTAAANDDPEQKFDALRNFQQAATFRVAVADLSGTLPLMKVSDRLTDIAELVLQAAMDTAWPELEAAHGTPRCRDGRQARDAQFAIIGYGKLGGLELGYGSDLDLVFLNDSEGDGQVTDGERPIENSMFFARLTRRIIHILTMPTPSGRLYEVDTRLRPSGRSGLLVSNLAAFERYQREDAWTWEHQALLRSRAVAGHPRVRQGFEEIRIRALTEYVRRDSLREDVASMRRRMRKELCLREPGRFDIKQARGGITDIEFIVQYLVLRDAADYPELLRWPDNIRQIETLAEKGILSRADAGLLADAYRDYRRRMHLLQLAGEAHLAPVADVEAQAAEVTGIWDRVFESAGGGAER